MKEEKKNIPEPDLYKGFDLSDYGNEDKAKAIINFLELEGANDELTENESCRTYTVNSRKVKEGTSPAQYERTIKAFKELLTPKQREMINSYLKLLGVLEWCECGKVKDKLYKKIAESLEKQKSSKNKDVLAKLEVCKLEALYPQNILYHLLWLPDHSPKTSYHSPEVEEPSYVKNYRQAWFGQKVIDYRSLSSRDDGEYLVLTDSEADRLMDDYCDNEMEDYWKQAVQAGNTFSGYRDWVQEVKDNDGRGPTLATYDGEENSVEVDGEWIYIYRTN
jgi:hypothetical protein